LVINGYFKEEARAKKVRAKERKKNRFLDVIKTYD